MPAEPGDKPRGKGMKGVAVDWTGPYGDTCGAYGYCGGTIEHASVKFLYFSPFIPLTRAIRVAWDDMATDATDVFSSRELKSWTWKLGDGE